MSCEHSLRFFQWISPFLTRKKTSHPHTFAHNKAPRSPKAHIRSIKIMYAQQSTAKHGTSVQRFYMYIHMLHSHASLVFTPSPIESDFEMTPVQLEPNSEMDELDEFKFDAFDSGVWGMTNRVERFEERFDELSNCRCACACVWAFSFTAAAALMAAFEARDTLSFWAPCKML